MQTAAARKIHRLSDFIIEEVSVVDRVANKRRFLSFKHEGTSMPTQAIQPDAHGTFTTGDAKPTKEPAVKGMESVEDVFYKVGEAVDRLMRVASVALQADSLKLDSGPDAATVTAEIEAVKSVLSEVADSINDLKKADELAKAAADKPVETAKADDTSVASKAVEQLTEFATMLSATQKSGASMSAPRLKRFTGALTELASILRDVGGDTKSLAKSEPAPAPEPKPEPTAKAAPAEDTEVAELRKKLVAREREVATLKRQPDDPTSITVEGDDVAPVPNYQWPADMTHPLDADAVGDEHFFG